MDKELRDYLADLDTDIFCAYRDGMLEYAEKLERERKRILRQVRSRRKHGENVELPEVGTDGRIHF